MGIRHLIVALAGLWSIQMGHAQTCTTLGQTPGTAFPVCGTDVFKQSSVPLCSTHLIAVPGCANAAALGGYKDKNPFWYQFTCYVSGTLGFSITPKNILDDYDWQLYDITGHNPEDVFSNSGLVVTGNWSGSSGLTGSSDLGLPFIQCASNPAENASTFSKMPLIIEGHRYLLMISHYTNSQSGYELSFSGGTGSITDPKIPAISKAFVSCDAQSVVVILNKRVRCNTLAQDGSDFSISYPHANITSIVGLNCNSSFDFDSFRIVLSGPLPAGDYAIVAKSGTDGNTLLDDCNNTLPVGDQVIFNVAPGVPAPFDSIAAIACAPSTLQFVFSRPIQCSSVAVDGSDFQLSGPEPVSIIGASGNCLGNLTDIITVTLSSPIFHAGAYQVTLKKGSDGNTLVDACNLQTSAGSTIGFSTRDTVNAEWTDEVLYGCRYDSIQFSSTAQSSPVQWQWTFDGGSSSLANPLAIYSEFGLKSAQLIVTNGTCSDTVAGTVTLGNTLKAAFTAPDEVCPFDNISFQNISVGNEINSWYWDFGDGSSSTVENPQTHRYPSSAGEVKYDLTLVVGNQNGCFDTTTQTITKLRSCYITVPSGFTPNGDGKNDYLYPLNAYKARNLKFKVFNRYGQLVFETADWTRKWDGTINGRAQDTGTYVWMLEYIDADTGKSHFQKGTTVLIR